MCSCFVDHCLSFCSFSFGQCISCPSIYGFCLPLLHLQPFLTCYILYKNLYNYVFQEDNWSVLLLNDLVYQEDWQIIYPNVNTKNVHTLWHMYISYITINILNCFKELQIRFLELFQQFCICFSLFYNLYHDELISHTKQVLTLNEYLSARKPHMILPKPLHTAANEPTIAKKWSSFIKVCPNAYNENDKLKIKMEVSKLVMSNGVTLNLLPW